MEKFIIKKNQPNFITTSFASSILQPALKYFSTSGKTLCIEITLLGNEVSPRVLATLDAALNNKHFERVSLRLKIREHLERGKFEQALDLYENHLKIYPKDKAFYITGLTICKYLKDKETAVMIFDYMKKNFSFTDYKLPYLEFLRVLVVCADTDLFQKTLKSLPMQLSAADLLTLLRDLGTTRLMKPKKLPFLLDEAYVINICNKIIAYGKSIDIQWTPQLLERLAEVCIFIYFANQKEYLYFSENLANEKIKIVEIFKLFKSIKEKPTQVTYLKTIEAYIRNSNVDEALQLLSEMETLRYEIPLGTFNLCISKSEFVFLSTDLMT